MAFVRNLAISNHNLINKNANGKGKVTLKTGK